MCDLFGCGDHARGPLPRVTDENRRAFLKGLAALPLAAVLAYPELARAQAARLTPVTTRTASGGTARGVLAMPEKTPAPAVLLIHEWYGLNDQIKSVAAEFAKEGYIALAVDLYGGEVASSSQEALRLMRAMSPKAATEELVAWIAWLRTNERSTGKVGTIGWCFGGGWSLNASLAAPVDATVIYYGDVAKTADQLASLKGPVLGHFGTLDRSMNREMVEGFETAMKAAGKPAPTIYWYDANHAFANPTGARYDAEDAKLAWERTLAFLKRHLADDNGA